MKDDDPLMRGRRVGEGAALLASLSGPSVISIPLVGWDGTLIVVEMGKIT